MDDLKGKKDSDSGSIIFDGVETVKSEIKLFEYNRDEFKRDKFEKCRKFKNKDSVKWIKMDGFSNIELQEIGKCFKLHPLVLEDIESDQRPKIEEYKEYLFLVLKSFDTSSDEILTKQVSFILGDQFVISIQDKENGLFDDVEKQIKIGESAVRNTGADFLLYSLVDAVLDSYFVILEDKDDEIGAIEKELAYRVKKDTLNSINKLKRDIITLRKSIWPVKEMTSTLKTSDFHLISDKTSPYLRDVHDHSIQVTEMVDIFRDTASGMFDTYLSSMSNTLNEIVRVLTIISVIFVPLTFLTGFFGMNFQNIIPLFSTAPVFYVFLVILFLIPVMMVIYFRRKGWLN